MFREYLTDLARRDLLLAAVASRLRPVLLGRFFNRGPRASHPKVPRRKE